LIGRGVALAWPGALLLGAAVILLAAPAPALARDRIAVLILPVNESDRVLTDNLTEVAISKVAELSDFDLVGTRELRRQLVLSGSAALPIGCLNETACLDRVGIAVGVRRVLSGSVRAEGTRFLVALAINDIESHSVERTFFRAVEGGVDALIGTVQDGVAELFQKKFAKGQLRIDSVPEGATVLVDEQQRGTTPLWLNPVEPGDHRLRIEMSGRFPWKKNIQLDPGQNLLVSVSKDDLAARRTWAPYAAYGTAAVAVLAFAAAGLFGTLARVDPRGSSRSETQMDLELRNKYATITNVFLASGVVFTGVSVLTFVRFRRDISGE
jgi:TolB-like protein